MAACKSVVVLCPNARRQTVKVGPTTTILQILEEVCKKQGLSCQEYAIKHQRKILDETLPIRYSGLSNNAHLEVVLHTKTVKNDAPCTIALQLASGERFLKDFPPEYSLWDVILYWNSQEDSPHHEKLTGEKGQEAVCVYMTQRVSGENTLKNTTLHSLGLTGKRAIIRLLHEVSTISSEPAVIESKKSSIQKESIPESSNQSSPITATNVQAKDRQLPSGIEGEISNVTPLAQDRHRQMDSKTVSPDRAARDPKRTRIAGPDPLFPDFKFPDRPAVKISETQSSLVTEERLHFLATSCERCPVVFKEDDQTLTVKDQDLPDSFYDVTIEDLRKMLQGLQSERVKSQDMPLLTKAMRESRRLEEMCKYERVVIRVKFPDRFALQGFFRPQEKVSALMEFVKSHLQDPGISFYLYTTPPRTELKNKNDTLFDVHLCPASLVYFGCKEKKDHFLSNHLLSNVATALDAEKTVLDSGICGSGTSRPSTDHGTEHDINSSTTTSNTTNEHIAIQSNNSVPPPGGSGGKVPKWFKGVGK